MADAKLTALAALANPTSDDLIYVVDDAGGTPVSKKATLGSGLMSYGVCQGRLTLTTATPVTTGDVSAATGIYFTPYVGDNIGLYNASGTWSVFTFAETNLSLNGHTATGVYDIFAYDNAGTLALESLIWTDGTTRATALAYQNGILVKSGTATRRYLGTIYINATGGQTEDTVIQRFVWNYYNRIPRQMAVGDATAHNYTTGAYRSWNANDALRLEVIVGVKENSSSISLVTFQETSLNGIGLDITDNNSFAETRVTSSTVTTVSTQSAQVETIIPLGYHFLQIVEYGIDGAQQSEAYLGMNFLA